MVRSEKNASLFDREVVQFIQSTLRQALELYTISALSRLR